MEIRLKEVMDAGRQCSLHCLRRGSGGIIDGEVYKDIFNNHSPLEVMENDIWAGGRDERTTLPPG
jgi:hypothetical protein